MQNKGSHLNDHLANERTFLAWIRTAIAIMAFGFVVAKFTLFVHQLSLLLGHHTALIPSNGYSDMLGILLVCVGVVTGLLAFFRYRKIKQNIEREYFGSSGTFVTWFAGLILVCGFLLTLYLVLNRASVVVP